MTRLTESLARPHLPAFLGGLVLGLVMLSLAGRASTQADLFPGVARFHRYLNPESLFFPTASQVVAHARAGARLDQTLVIVGGSSVLYGSGQGTAEIWTDALQEQLGPAYGVVNLGFPSGTSGEHGSVAAQALIKEGRDLVFVVHIYPDFGAADGIMYRYVVHDAIAKGLLLPSPERDRLVTARLATPTDTVGPELRLRAALDSVFYFTDLWGAVGHRWVFTNWQQWSIPGRRWWSPRDGVPDPAGPIFPPEQYYPAWADEVSMAQMNAEAAVWCSPTSNEWGRIRDIVAAALPPGLRERSLAVVTTRSSHYTSRLTADQQACSIDYLKKLTAQMNAEGFRAQLVGADWGEDDFTDRVHPSGPGGRKLAAEIAPIVRAIAGR